MAAADAPPRPPTAHSRKCRQARRRIPLYRRHSDCRAKEWSRASLLSGKFRGSRGERAVLAVPMLGNVQPGGDPYAIVRGDMVKEAHEPGRASGAPNQT